MISLVNSTKYIQYIFLKNIIQNSFKTTKNINVLGVGGEETKLYNEDFLRTKNAGDLDTTPQSRRPHKTGRYVVKAEERNRHSVCFPPSAHPSPALRLRKACLALGSSQGANLLLLWRLFPQGFLPRLGLWAHCWSSVRNAGSEATERWFGGAVQS